ncbi:hypothetical protein OZX67_02150 [Bifidobacterium sp. ESL0728]|uniref:hypothetical protein n=1 Tax=Bifidobacterium sp. ESL0728 TaxID=2983220 RepID=UPI0023F7ED9E|nr:hypothetical protein [Bifidobacterium sp. ESL0728]WEV59387.1 hypothetical protein OZX67_02150 [Bifidobacterium sp. ESL0728]
MAGERFRARFGEASQSAEYFNDFKKDVQRLCEKVCADDGTLFGYADLLLYQSERVPLPVHTVRLEEALDKDTPESQQHRIELNTWFMRYFVMWREQFDRYTGTFDDFDDEPSSEILDDADDGRFKSSTGALNSIIGSWYTAIARETLANAIRSHYPYAASADDAMLEELSEIFKQNQDLAGFLGLVPSEVSSDRHTNQNDGAKSLRGYYEDAKNLWITNVTQNCDQRYLAYFYSKTASKRKQKNDVPHLPSMTGKPLGREDIPRAFNEVVEWVVVDTLLSVAWAAEQSRFGPYWQAAMELGYSIVYHKRPDSAFHDERVLKDYPEVTEIVNECYQEVGIKAANLGLDERYKEDISIESLLDIALDNLRDNPIDVSLPIYDRNINYRAWLNRFAPMDAKLAEIWKGMSKAMRGLGLTPEDYEQAVDEHQAEHAHEEDNSYDEFANDLEKDAVHNSIQAIMEWMSSTLDDSYEESLDAKKHNDPFSISGKDVRVMQARLGAAYRERNGDSPLSDDALQAEEADEIENQYADPDQGKKSKNTAGKQFRRAGYKIMAILYVFCGLCTYPSFDTEDDVQNAIDLLCGHEECGESLHLLRFAAPFTKRLENGGLAVRIVPDLWRNRGKTEGRDANAAVERVEALSKKQQDGARKSHKAKRYQYDDPIVRKLNELDTKTEGCRVLHAAEHVVIDAHRKDMENLAKETSAGSHDADLRIHMGQPLCVDTFGGRRCSQ